MSLRCTDNRQGLEFEGLKPLKLVGKLAVNKRNENIKKFKSPVENYRVLVMSSVANAGLNLHEARFMIFAVRTHIFIIPVPHCPSG